jgi:arylsulfatase A-like enzyme
MRIAGILHSYTRTLVHSYTRTLTPSAHSHPLHSTLQFKNSTRRGMFGDALAEVDWIVGEVTKTLEENNLDKNTLILFTGDNGPWMIQV